MKIKLLSLLLLSTFMLFSCSDSDDSDNPTTTTDDIYPDLTVYEFNKTKDVIKYVCDAAEKLKEVGEAAFTEFDTEDWFFQDNYVFVYTTDGTLLYNPTDEDNIGLSILDKTDEWGKKFIQESIDVINNDDDEAGWIHYRWFIPRLEQLAWKSSYVKKVKSSDGQDLIVGSGQYYMPMEKAFVIDEVQSAVQLIQDDTENAFDIMRDTTEKYIYRDTYVFVLDINGTTLVNPLYPEDEGVNQIDKQDVDGTYFIKEIIDLAKDSGKGWVSYMIPRVSGEDAEKKYTYIEKVSVGGNTYVVGSGMFYD